MKEKENTSNKRNITGSYVTSVISITLVLFLLGIVGMLVLNAQKLSDLVKENLGFSVILKENLKEIDIIKLQKILDTKNYVKTTDYITKEEAAEELRGELGENFVEFLGYNPLPVSIDVKLYASYANPDSIKIIENDLQAFNQVKEVIYQESLIEALNENVKTISLIILTFSTLLILISIALINNTIRLSIYSKRFIIYTMQLVGATRRFIRIPFVLKGILQGIYAALLSIMAITGILYGLREKYSYLIEVNNIYILSVLSVGIISMGIIITWLSTYFAVNKYLNVKFDKLFY